MTGREEVTVRDVLRVQCSQLDEVCQLTTPDGSQLLLTLVGALPSIIAARSSFIESRAHKDWRRLSIASPMDQGDPLAPIILLLVQFFLVRE